MLAFLPSVLLARAIQSSHGTFAAAGWPRSLVVETEVMGFINSDIGDRNSGDGDKLLSGNAAMIFCPLCGPSATVYMLAYIPTAV